MNKNIDKDCFEGFSKIVILFLIPILVGYIIFEIEKIDTIRTKKMESFEIIIDSFNEISKKSYHSNLESGINFIYDIFLLSQDMALSKQKQIDEINNYLSKGILELKFEKLKYDRIADKKNLEIEVKTLITKIKHHENLLKSYYGYSINDDILSISKMLSIIETNQEKKEQINEDLLKIIEKDIKPILFKTIDVHSIEEAKKIEKDIEQKINSWVSRQENILNLTQKLKDLYQKESAKLYEDIYSIYSDELNTSIFKLYTEKNKEKFSKIVYSIKNKDIRLEVLEDNNGDFYFKELKK